MRIKKGDNVLIITGKDRGKKGKVITVLPEKNKVVVEGINISIRQVRPRRQGEKGQRVEVATPLDVSNVKLICPQCGKPTRVGFKKLAKIKKRVCKRCKQTF